jgi:hypothetical protein
VECNPGPSQSLSCPGTTPHPPGLACPPPPRPAPPRAFHLEARAVERTHFRSRTSSSYASVEISRRARYYFTALVWRKVRFRLSVHSCLPLPFFSRAPLRASAALKRRISTFENPNLRPSTPLKKRPLRLSPSSEKESIRSCLNIAPSLLANLPSLETSIVALKAQPSKRNLFSRPSLPLSGLPSVTERDSCRISVCRHY